MQDTSLKSFTGIALIITFALPFGTRIARANDMAWTYAPYSPPLAIVQVPTVTSITSYPAGSLLPTIQLPYERPGIQAIYGGSIALPTRPSPTITVPQVPYGTPLSTAWTDWMGW